MNLNFNFMNNSPRGSVLPYLSIREFSVFLRYCALHVTEHTEISELEQYLYLCILHIHCICLIFGLLNGFVFNFLCSQI